MTMMETDVRGKKIKMQNNWRQSEVEDRKPV